MHLCLNQCATSFIIKTTLQITSSMIESHGNDVNSSNHKHKDIQSSQSTLEFGQALKLTQIKGSKNKRPQGLKPSLKQQD